MKREMSTMQNREVISNCNYFMMLSIFFASIFSFFTNGCILFGNLLSFLCAKMAMVTKLVDSLVLNVTFCVYFLIAKRL